jgi:UDP-glucose 4-epimerase
MAAVLVTGGAGFIGSHLVRALLERGDRVRVLDNLSTGQRANLVGLDPELTVGDIRDLETVRRALQGVDQVFHLAAMISPAESMADPLTCYAVNLTGTLNVLLAGRDAGVGGAVLASSAAVYGNAEGSVSEASPTRPRSPYGDSKLAMEGAGRLFHTAYGLPVVSLRFFNAYGPRQSPDSPYAAAIPIFTRKMLAGQAPVIDGDGRQTRDFVHVGDIVQACLLAVEKASQIEGSFNIGGGRSISILELVETLGRLIPGTPAATFGPPRPGDIHFSACDMSRAQQALGYRPRIALEEGLRDTIQSFREAERHRTA